MRTRNVRIDDDIWQLASERAKEEEATVSQVIRRLLRQYATGQMPAAQTGGGAGD